MNAFIFHGTGGSSQGNWFPWLKQQLEEQNIKTSVPNFPTPQGESLEAWRKVLDAEDEKVNEQSIMVGHSKGGMFLLKVLEQLDKPVFAAIFVSAPIGEKPIKYYDSDKKFSGFKFDWPKIRTKAKHFVVIHSDESDPYISPKNGKKLAHQLGVELYQIPNAGHLNEESGYKKFDELLEIIKKLIY